MTGREQPSQQKQRYEPYTKNDVTKSITKLIIYSNNKQKECHAYQTFIKYSLLVPTQAFIQDFIAGGGGGGGSDGLNVMLA